jgi:hypothetical protein
MILRSFSFARCFLLGIIWCHGYQPEGSGWYLRVSDADNQESSNTRAMLNPNRSQRSITTAVVTHTNQTYHE